MRQDLTGRTLGHYVIEELLGSGGMGQVYRAVHRRLNRPAAVKVMHPHLAAEPTFQERFQREARAAASLDHPNIIGVYDFDEEDGLLYIAMEYVPNGSVRGLLPAHDPSRRTPLPVGLDLVRQAADGLHYAHTRGMIHRDIKPDNLLLKTYDGQAYPDRRYTVVISDFGLARLREGGTLTASGVMMGTPAYMAPEQFQDKEIDGRSDIYALGVVLYEVATGYLPFEARTISDAAYKHVHTPPTRPRDVHPDVPDAVEAIILRCLAKDPDDRYPDAAALSAELRETLTQSGQFDHSTYVPGPDPIVVDGPPPPVTPPPFVPTLAGASDWPRVQILDQSGRPLHVAEVSDAGLTIGSADGNDIALPERNLANSHLRLDLDGDAVRVTDLGSSGGTFLDDERLPSRASRTWPQGAWLRAGSAWLWFTPSLRGSRDSAPVDAPDADISGALRPSGAGRIYVLVDSDRLDITPGQPASVRVTLANLGRTVDHLQLDVEGIPGDWVRVPDQGVQLNPGTNTQMDVLIDVPRAPESHAGDYHVTLRARSHASPSESGSANALWSVGAFRGLSAELLGDGDGDRSGDAVRVALANTGNVPERVALRGEDRGRALRFRFGSEEVVVEPGERVAVPVDVNAPRRLIGGSSTYPFTIRAAVESGGEREMHGQITETGRIPFWAVPVLVLAGLGICVAGFLVIRELVGGSDGPGQRRPIEITAVPVPNAPSDLTLSLSLTAITVSWQHDGQAVDHFVAERRVNDQEFERVVATRDLAFRDLFENLPANPGRIARVTYRVQAISPDGEPSGFSREASIEAPIFPSN